MLDWIGKKLTTLLGRWRDCRGNCPWCNSVMPDMYCCPVCRGNRIFGAERWKRFTAQFADEDV